MTFPVRTLLMLILGGLAGPLALAHGKDNQLPALPTTETVPSRDALPTPKSLPSAAALASRDVLPPREAVPAVEALPESGGGLLDDLFGKFLPRIGYSYDGLDTVGRDGGLSAFQMFVPLWEDRSSSQLVFSDSRLLLFDSRGTLGANLGLGGRLFSDSLGRTVGGYVYWDYSDTGRASFNQVSGGVETLGDRVDARANFYVPVGKDRKQVDQLFTANPEPYFQGNNLLSGGGQGLKFFEQALYGFDTEAGLKVLALEGLEMRAFAGMYHYQGEDAQQAWGPRGRLEARVRDSLAMGVSVQNDRLFGTTVNFNMLMSYPRMSGRGYNDGPSAPLAASDRLGDPIVRVQHVAVDRQKQRYVVAGTPLADPRTGQPYVFLHVAPGGNSDGSFESPYARLGAAFADPRFAGGNVVVYDRTSGTYAGNVAFGANTKLLSAAPVQVLETTTGRVVLPFSGVGGELPKVQGTITLASHSSIAGFDLAGKGRGAVVSGDGVVRDVVLAHNTFSGEGTAVWLPSVAGLVDLHDNRINAPTAGGVVLGTRDSNSATVTITQTQITKPGADAIAVTASEKSSVNVHVEGATVSGAGGTGLALATDATAQATIQATVRNNRFTDGSSGVTLMTTGKTGGSRIVVSVANNEMRNHQGTAVTARASGPNTLVLDLVGNRASSPFSLADFLLQQQKKSTFQTIDPARLGSRNVGSIVTTGTLQGVSTLPAQ